MLVEKEKITSLLINNYLISYLHVERKV